MTLRLQFTLPPITIHTWSLSMNRIFTLAALAFNSRNQITKGSIVKSRTIILAIAAFSGYAFCGSIASDTKVLKIMTDKNIPNSVFVKTAATIANKPCGSTDWDYVIYDDTQMGKNMLSILLTAYSTGSLVTIQGEGACSGDTEKLLRIYLK